MNPTIFNVQKFSLDDGPGIRTTVFFKGCPLRCAWCSNPESQTMKPSLEYQRSLCIGCGACAAASPAITLTGDGIVIDHALLDRTLDEAGFQALADVCPTGALSVVGKATDLDEVVETCLQDTDFYEESGGGVTLTGGEILLWPEAAAELAGKLHEHGIHVAIETSGFAPEKAFRTVLDAVDLLLFDMKHYDDAYHKAGTGVGLDTIHHNLALAIASPKEVLLRLPVIPGFNDDVSNAEGFAQAVEAAMAEAAALPGDGTGHSMERPRMQLLPYHSFGESKYTLLGRDYAYEGLKSLRPEQVEPLRDELLKNSVEAFI